MDKDFLLIVIGIVLCVSLFSSCEMKMSHDKAKVGMMAVQNECDQRYAEGNNTTLIWKCSDTKEN